MEGEKEQMLTQQQARKLNDIIDRFVANAKSVTKKEILDFGEEIQPNSPKTGKPITFGSFAGYMFHDLPSHLNKYELIQALESIADDETQIQKVGFFS